MCGCIIRNMSYVKMERINGENFVSKPERLLFFAVISNHWQIISRLQDVITEFKFQSKISVERINRFVTYFHTTAVYCISVVRQTCEEKKKIEPEFSVLRRRDFLIAGIRSTTEKFFSPNAFRLKTNFTVVRFHARDIPVTPNTIADTTLSSLGNLTS